MAQVSKPAIQQAWKPALRGSAKMHPSQSRGGKGSCHEFDWRGRGASENAGLPERCCETQPRWAVGGCVRRFTSPELHTLFFEPARDRLSVFRLLADALCYQSRSD